MDFSKTRICQRTRSCYEKLYLEFNEKKHDGRVRNRRGSGGDSGLGCESGDDPVKKVGESPGKSNEGVTGSDGRRKFDFRSSKTRKGRKGRGGLGKVLKRGKSAEPVRLIDESEANDDDVELNESSPGSHSEFGIRKGKKKLKRGKSLERGKNASRNSAIDELEKDATNDSHHNSDDDDALSLLGNNAKSSKSLDHGSVKFEKKSDKGFLSNITASNGDCLKGKRGLEESDDHEDVTYLGDDITCLDDYDPSHSSRVGSNEVKVSPVELDSIEADADEGDELQQVPTFSEIDDDDLPGWRLSEDEAHEWQDMDPPENAAADNGAGKDVDVISLSSSSEDDETEDEDDDDDDDDDEASVIEVENINDIRNEFWTEVVKKGPSENLNSKGKSTHETGNKKDKKKVNVAEHVSKKRRTDQNPSLSCSKKAKLKWQEAIQGEIDQPFWVEDHISHHSPSNGETVHETSTQRAWNNTGKKPFGSVINVIRVLTETLKKGGDGNTVLEKYVTPIEDEILQKESSVEQELLYKFRFEEDEEMKSENYESDTEVDGLFKEMNMYIQSSEIGYSGTSLVDRVDADSYMENVDQATLCRLGKHQLTINDQFGIICRYCAYVEIEIRDILPPLTKNGRGGGHNRHENDTDKPDGLKFSDLQRAECHHHEPGHDSKRTKYEKGTVWDLVPGVKESMYQHQRDGFEFIWKKIAGGTYIDTLQKKLPNGGSGCIISHAPGTGKSRLTIVFLQSFMRMYSDARPLIIAPRSMLLTWEAEFKKWNLDVPFYLLNNKDFSGQEDTTAASFLKQGGYGKSQRCLRLLKLYSWKKKSSVLGMTYSLFQSLAGKEGKRRTKKKKTTNSSIINPEDAEIRRILLESPTVVVLDEGHTPRNDESLVWKALLNLKTKRSIILSGTPFQNNFHELYNTFCLVNPSLPFEISSIRNESFTVKRGRKKNSLKGQWDSITSDVAKDEKKLHELRKMIDPFVHVHKGTILQEKLPGLRDALVVLKPTKLQQSFFKKVSQAKFQVENDYLMSLVSVHPSLLLEHFSNNPHFQKLLKIYESDPQAGVKTDFVMELLKLCGSLNERVLVFSMFTKPLKFIMELLEQKFKWDRDREFLYMDGSQEEKNRQTSINALNDPKSQVKILLASIRACSEGINLVGASRVVLLDVQWNPSVERQAISRAYRLGQQKLVYVYHLVTGIVEGEKYIRQVEKSQLSELVFSSKNGSGSNPRISSMVSADKILEEMVQHEKLQHMFEKVIYQPKESDLIQTFG